jgi:hypothetical protein
MQQANTGEFEAKFGQWISSVSRERSSNWQAMGKFMELLEAKARAGQLTGWELFLCTDNSVFEGVFYNGYSASEELDALALRIHVLELQSHSLLHVIHVSAKRMIAQGTGDGL